MKIFLFKLFLNSPWCEGDAADFVNHCYFEVDYPCPAGRPQSRFLWLRCTRRGYIQSEKKWKSNLLITHKRRKDLQHFVSPFRLILDPCFFAPDLWPLTYDLRSVNFDLWTFILNCRFSVLWNCLQPLTPYLWFLIVDLSPLTLDPRSLTSDSYIAVHLTCVDFFKPVFPFNARGPF